MDGSNSQLIAQELLAQQNLEMLLAKEEKYWIEKSKLNWHLEGDKNTSLFHSVAKIRNFKSSITILKDDNNILFYTRDIANHVVTYFTNIFCFAEITNNLDIMNEMIPQLVDSSMNKVLTCLPTPEEIKFIVSNLNKTSAPSPIVFGGYFYHTYWEIIK